MSGRLAGKIAIVTGAARGIGRGVAQAYHAEGAKVYALDRFGDELNSLDPEIKPIVIDLLDPEAVTACFAQIEAEAGRIDILVNNAGIIFFKPVEEVSVQDWDQLININLRGPFLGCRAVAPGMKARKSGVIINVSSNAGVTGGKDESTYCASKFGLEGLSRALAVEFAPYGVRVNTITPGHPVHTSMSEVTYSADKRQIWKAPSELAPAFVRLAMEDCQINDRYIRAWDLVQEERLDQWV